MIRTLTAALCLAIGCAEPSGVRGPADGPDPLDDTTPGATTPRDDHLTSPYDPPSTTATDASSSPTAPTDPVEACPPGVICVDQLPFDHAATTTGGSQDYDAYACAPTTNEAGPEVVYRVRVEARGFLALTLSGVPAGVDVDVHLLGSPDADDCIDRGHWEGASWVEPGEYWVVVDSWVDGSGDVKEGDYTLSFRLITPDGYVAEGLDDLVLGRALWAFDKAWKDGDATRLRLAVADFDLTSDQRRFWLLDLATADLLFHDVVTHGEGSSDPDDASRVVAMSNINDSHMSSVGVMIAAEPYWGSNGYSMRLDGLEPGFNDLVRARAIVVHAGTYATQAFVALWGVLGQSWGCAVVDPAIHEEVIEALQDGGVYVSSFSDPDWLAQSAYVKDYRP